MTRETMVAKLEAFYSAGVEVLNEWYATEAMGDEVPNAKYPFAESFDEVLASLADFIDNVREWSKQS